MKYLNAQYIYSTVWCWPATRSHFRTNGSWYYILSNASLFWRWTAYPLRLLSNPNDCCHHHLIIRNYFSIHTGKKTKPLISFNLFSLMASEENIEIELDTTCDVPNIIYELRVYYQHDNIRAPLIYVKNINNFSAFKNILVQIIDPNGFTYKSSSSFLIVHFHGPLNLNAIKRIIE